MNDPSLAYAVLNPHLVSFRSYLDPYRTKTRITSSDDPTELLHKGSHSSNELLHKGSHSLNESKLAQIQPFFAFDFYERVRDHLELPRVSTYFINRAGEKLANLDALYDITTFDIINGIDNRPWRCLDLGAAPGAWTQYLQYRMPHCFTYVMTLDEERGGLPLDRSHLDYDRLDVVSPYHDLRIHSIEFSQYVLDHDNDGVDLIVGDAASGNTETAEQSQQRLLLGEIVIALTCGKIGSHLVLKFFGGIHLPTRQLLWIISQCYDEAYISKPATSRAVNEELYIVGKSMNRSRDYWQPLVTEWYRQSSADYESFVSSPETGSLPLLIKEYRKILLDASMAVVAAMKEFVSSDQRLDLIPNRGYQVARLLQAWVIPS